MLEIGQWHDGFFGKARGDRDISLVASILFIYLFCLIFGIVQVNFSDFLCSFLSALISVVVC